MCFMSLVMQEWRPYVPSPTAIPPNQQWREPIPSPTPGVEFTPEQLAAFLDAFRKAAEAARAFDVLTGQPDCVDPEKAKLEERVTELERRLAEAVS